MNWIRTALHLPPSEKIDGRVRQIIRSCKLLASNESIYGWTLSIFATVDDYKPGYGKVAAIEDLDADFLVFRKFGWLHNYALLYLQDELVQQQGELERFDNWEHGRGDPTKLVSRRKNQSPNAYRRQELVSKLQAKLAQYGEQH